MQKLKGVPETMLIPLWAKAEETQHINPIIIDKKSVEIMNKIDYDFAKFKKSWLTQIGVSVRTLILDKAVENFLQHKTNAVIINIGAGLDTRFERLKNAKITCWYDIDLPKSIELRRRFFCESKQNKFISKSVFNYSWMDEIEEKNTPVLIIAEGILMYFDEEEVKTLLNRLANRFPNAEMVFESLAPFLEGRAKIHESVSKIDNEGNGPVEFKWSVKDPKKVESLSPAIKLITSWNYYDFHKDRWSWFGRLNKISFVRNNLSNRIIHIKFLPI